MGQISDILDQLSSGKIGTGAAAEKLRAIRKFAPPPPTPTIAALLGGEDDPYGPEQEDDGHELGSAFHGGEITLDQYKVLYEAYRDARAAASGTSG